MHFSEKEIIEVILDIFTLLVKDKEAISQISNNNEIVNDFLIPASKEKLQARHDI